METTMKRDEIERHHARQDLLEAFSAGFSGAACAPMPGVLLEMLEIAAIQRRLAEQILSVAPTASLLTRTKNSSGMASKMRRTGKAAAYVACRLGSYLGVGRLPA